MSSLLKERLMNRNPANPVETTKADPARVPMSVPRLRLEAPEIPGYHTHWMLGTPARLAQALKGGYVYVNDDEVGPNNFGVADDIEKSGSTDMGSRVSVIAGTDTERGQAVRLYLMKIKLEWWMEDQAMLAQKNESIAEALRGGYDLTPNPGDPGHRYIKPENRNILQPRKH